MKLLVDVNIILDVLLDRPPHASASAAVWAAIEQGTISGVISAHAVTTVYYLLRKKYTETGARTAISALLTVFRVAGVDSAVITAALQFRMDDFEDAVSAAAGAAARCDAIVTRDPKGFRRGPLPVVTPAAAVRGLP